MNGESSFHDGNICVPVFSFTDGVGEAFFETLGLDPQAGGSIAFGDRTAQLELVRITADDHPGLGEVVSRADAALLVVKFLDQVTMNRIRDVYRGLNAEIFLIKSIAILRDPKEAEFKISCTYCGQKLWVRDRDAGRRGNCPQCRKTFFIPTQKSYLTSFLMLTDEVPVVTAVKGEGSCRDAIKALIDRMISMEDGMKSSTMRIELPPENGE